MIEIRYNDFEDDESVLADGYFLYDTESQGGEVLASGFATEDDAAQYRDALNKESAARAAGWSVDEEGYAWPPERSATIAEGEQAEDQDR
jgi:hypothetical protein